jgi:predicted DsbA family dithiol-disulfide isomerase
LDEVVETVKKVEAVQTEQPKEEEPSKRQIEVTCADDAKEYLVEKYGISRTKLRSLKSIKDTAEQKGIEFIGID